MPLMPNKDVCILMDSRLICALQRRFCNDECRRKGMEEHKAMCPMLADCRISLMTDSLGEPSRTYTG